MTNKVCTENECDKPMLARGLCSKHYTQASKAAGGFAPRTVQERFWAKVEKTDDCWLWRGAHGNGKGYGVLFVDGVKVRVQRLSYEWHVGPIPDGFVVDHLCKNTACVRPDHLEAVTQQVNVQRKSMQRNNTSGERGVSWSKKDMVWACEVWANGRRHRKSFRDYDEAVVWVRAVRAELHG